MRNELKQAIEFVIGDIGRELLLARLNRPLEKNLVELLGVNSGGGNWLAAAGLMVYTEAFGQWLDRRKRNGAAFNLVFDKIYGHTYREGLSARLQEAKMQGLLPTARNADVYDVFRCGLAHEYWIKGSAQVAMFGDVDHGVGIINGRPFIVVDRYFKDMCAALENNFGLEYKAATKNLNHNLLELGVAFSD